MNTDIKTLNKVITIQKSSNIYKNNTARQKLLEVHLSLLLFVFSHKNPAFQPCALLIACYFPAKNYSKAPLAARCHHVMRFQPTWCRWKCCNFQEVFLKKKDWIPPPLFLLGTTQNADRTAGTWTSAPWDEVINKGWKSSKIEGVCGPDTALPHPGFFFS